MIVMGVKNKCEDFLLSEYLKPSLKQSANIKQNIDLKNRFRFFRTFRIINYDQSPR